MGAARIRGTTTADYARDLGIKLQSLKDITTGRSTSKRVQDRISADYPEVVEAHPWEQEQGGGAAAHG
jgi:hypothetical protein